MVVFDCILFPVSYDIFLLSIIKIFSNELGNLNSFTVVKNASNCIRQIGTSVCSTIERSRGDSV